MNRLRELRLKKSIAEDGKRLTQAKLVEELNKRFYKDTDDNKEKFSKMNISNWENNKHRIKPEKAQQLADYFGVSVGYLLGYSEDSTQYDDEKLSVDPDGTIYAYSEKRNYAKDLQIFVDCLKILDIVISDDQINMVFDLIQSMNLNNEQTYIGSLITYDILQFRNVNEFYNEMSRDGYSKLVEDTDQQKND